MENGQNWDKTNTIDMIRHRAFFSMAATDRGVFAFGGLFIKLQLLTFDHDPQSRLQQLQGIS